MEEKRHGSVRWFAVCAAPGWRRRWQSDLSLHPTNYHILRRLKFYRRPRTRG